MLQGRQITDRNYSATYGNALTSSKNVYWGDVIIPFICCSLLNSRDASILSSNGLAVQTVAEWETRVEFWGHTVQAGDYGQCEDQWAAMATNLNECAANRPLVSEKVDKKQGKKGNFEMHGHLQKNKKNGCPLKIEKDTWRGSNALMLRHWTFTKDLRPFPKVKINKNGWLKQKNQFHNLPVVA